MMPPPTMRVRSDMTPVLRNCD